MRPTDEDGKGRLHWFIAGMPELLRVVLTASVGFSAAFWTTDGIDAMFKPPAVAGGWITAGLLILLGVGHFTFLKPTYTDALKNAEKAKAKTREAQAEVLKVRAEMREVGTSLQRTIDTLARILLHQLKMYNASTRISVYSVEHDELVLVSRQSVNADHEVRGRRAYPLRQGIIGQAWRNDSAIQFSSASDRAEWESECVATHGFTAAVANKLTMMARSTLAIRLDTQDADKVGMLVIESEVEDRKLFDKRLIGIVRRWQVHLAMVNIIAKSHQHFPRVRERAGERNGDKNAAPQLDEPGWKNMPDPPGRQEGLHPAPAKPEGAWS